MRKKEPDIFEDFHNKFAEDNNLSREHLDIIIHSMFQGLQYYLGSPEAPSISIPNFFSFKINLTNLKKRLRELARIYWSPGSDKVVKMSVYEEFKTLNLIKKRVRLEHHFRNIKRKQKNGRFKPFENLSPRDIRFLTF